MAPEEAPASSTEPRPGNEAIKTSINSGVGASWLIAVYWVTIGLSVMILGAQQFHQKVAASAGANPTLAMTIGELISARHEFRVRQDQIDTLEKERGRQSETLSKTKGDKYVAESATSLAEASAAFAVRKVYDAVIFDARMSKEATSLAFNSSVPSRFMAQELRPLVKSDGASKLLDAYDKEERKWTEASATAMSLKSKLEQIERDMNNLAVELKARTDDLTNYLKAFRNAPDAPRGTNAPNNLGLLYELDSFNTLGFFWFGIIDPLKFVTLPGSVMTLVLALSMGALGSTLFVTSEYFKPTELRTISWYFFRPFLGMITALSVFVAFKAGQLTISGSAPSLGTEADLNPFLISFFAMIAGLLSEHAIGRLSGIGQSWLNNLGKDDGQGNKGAGSATVESPRVAKGLYAKDWAAKFGPVSGKSAADLAAALGLDQTRIDTWAERKEAVPPEMADDVVKYFSLPKTDVFDEVDKD